MSTGQDKSHFLQNLLFSLLVEQVSDGAPQITEAEDDSVER